MNSRDYCDGVSRRAFLMAGSLGLLGLDLASHFRRAAGATAGDRSAPKNAIQIFLGGGQSHLDTWDLKPEATDVCGEFKPISTNVPGIEICEHLPLLARQADKYAILRSVGHTLGSHDLGQLMLWTGNRPLPSLRYPAYGSVISKEFDAKPGLPTYVALPIQQGAVGAETAGYLGSAYNPFTVREDPNADEYRVRALAMPTGLSDDRIAARRGLRDGLNTAFRSGPQNGVALNSRDLEGLDRFYQTAFDILKSPTARAAFAVDRESSKSRMSYGRHSFGQACLVARRLIEAGVRYVSIDYGGWDTHESNFSRLKNDKLPKFDRGVSTLLADLAERGLLNDTAVLITGEFGRTPKINKRDGGRDHWPRAMSIVMAGGGVRGGQIIGRTNDKGEEPAERPLKPEDAAASFYHALCIDHHKEYHTSTGRPIEIVRDGTVIEELF